MGKKKVRERVTYKRVGRRKDGDKEEKRKGEKKGKNS